MLDRAAHSGSLPQARQLSLVPSQIGFAGEAQALLAVHWTQAPASVPPVTHTGVAGYVVWHSLVPLLQARQLCAVVLQNGVAPEQLAFDVHCTQLFDAVSQTLPLGQWPLPVQATQAPVAVLHAGVVEDRAEHWLSAVQAAQLPPEQIGVVGPVHWPLALQFAHAPAAQ